MTSAHAQREPIAIVGVAAQLPSGTYAKTNLDYGAFIDFLLDKGEAYEPIPPTRFNVKYIKGNATGQVLADTGAFLKDVDMFDHMEFGITARDARAMPLSTRKLVETSFLSLMDAGIHYRGQNVGCYMAGVVSDIHSTSGHDDTEATGSFANVPAMVANRVSYHLDLRGPTVPLDTACSSSLYATHIACQALRDGECEAAVVGGCQMNHRFADWLTYTQGGILSPDGKCKPFDAGANGFGRGEGVVVIVLKPLAAALRDHDRIYATVLGTGVNSCGSLAPPNAPVASAQREAMVRALKMAGRLPSEVDFLELHATGTASGDPTEANWIGAEFKRNGEILMGSVKGNVGHLEITSFLVSLCKVLGSFERETVIPNVNFRKANPAIRWKQYRLRVPIEPAPLRPRSGNGRALVAMTSSAIGGANGSAVVEGPPPSSLTDTARSTFWMDGAEIPALLVAGGLSPRSAAAVKEALICVAENEHVYALARMFGRRARSLTWREAFVVGAAPQKDSKPMLAPKTRPPIVFVFSGQGTQHFDMGRELFKTCAPFRDTVLQLDRVYAEREGKSLIESTGLFAEKSSSTADDLGDAALWPMTITLPALTMLQLALVDALAAVGVRPDAVVGHSAGETAVLSASGAATKIAAFELAIARGYALEAAGSCGGAMAALSSSPRDAKALIDAVKGELGEGSLAVGCNNSAGAVTLSGSGTLIDAAVARASKDGIFARRLRTRIPVHSELMEISRDILHTRVSDVFSRHTVHAPTVETYSTVTGKAYDRVFDVDYYWNNTRGVVHFDEAISALLAKHGGATFVEIGPHPVLSAYLHDRANSNIASPLRRPRSSESSIGVETREFVGALGKLIVAGHNCVDFDSLYGAQTQRSTSKERMVTLAYPFAPKAIPWCVESTPEMVRQRQKRNGPMNYPQLAINRHTHPGLADHVIKDEPIMPAAGFVEMALEFGASEVFDVEFHSLLSLSSERPLPVEVKLEGTKWTVSSASKVDYASIWPIKYNRLHASGFLSTAPTPERSYPRLDLDAIRSGMVEMAANADAFYSRLTFVSPYGPLYRRVRKCFTATSAVGVVNALVELQGAGQDLPNLTDYVIHPAILDAAIQITIHPALTGNFDTNFYHIPSRVRAFRLCPGYFSRSFPETVFSYATYEDWTPDSVTYTVTLTDETGAPMCVMEGLELARHGFRQTTLDKRYDVMYHPAGLTVEVAEDSGVHGIVSSHAATKGHVPTNGNSQSAPNGVEADLDGAKRKATTQEVNSETVVTQYTRGEEMDLQRQLSQRDPQQPLSLFLFAQDDMSSHALEGFSRSLRKEYPAWTVRMATFDPSWSASQVRRAIQQLVSRSPTTPELKIDKDGAAWVPRIEVSTVPTGRMPFAADMPWKLENGYCVQAFPHAPSDDYVVVRVTGIGARHGNSWEFVGTVEGHPSPVAGIAFGGIASHAVVHRRAIVDTSPDSLHTPSILASALVALTIGPHTISDSDRLRSVHVLVVVDDAGMRTQIQAVCSQLGIGSTVVSTLQSQTLESLYLKKPSHILSSTRDAKEIAVLRGVLAPRGKLFLWNDPQEGLESFHVYQPWDLGDALSQATKFSSHSQYSAPSTLLPASPINLTRSSGLFNPNKSYILIGGLGSLGVNLALWMYENGARHLVLTSRSGADSIDIRGDYMSQRILSHLRRQTDLSLRTVAVDGASEGPMADLLHSIEPPLAGCMLLAGMLDNHMFALQTPEQFERVFTPKVGSFHALESAIDISSLDFLVGTGSVVGVFGNGGQTNYSAANSTLAGLTSKYRNAFTVVSPLIVDSNIVMMKDEEYRSRTARHWMRWGFTARELCDAVGDGIMKIRDGPIRQHIPDFDWRVIRDNLGPDPLYDHLVPADESDEATDGGQPTDKRTSLFDVVCRVLELRPDEASVDVPLTSYGLDSVSAAALSFALRPLLVISQVQLLADITIKELQSRVSAEA